VQYLLLIYNDEREWLALPEDERRAVTGRYFALVDELRREGKYVGGAPLRPTTEARTVTRETGTTLVTDGPFAETKEVLGGYYLIEAPNLDAALEIAKEVPAKFGGVEVRPIRDMS
jgi:hypothetical protein